MRGRLPGPRGGTGGAGASSTSSSSSGATSYGLPCAVDTDCSTGFCIDGACGAATLEVVQGPNAIAGDATNVYRATGSVIAKVPIDSGPVTFANTVPCSAAYSSCSIEQMAVGPGGLFERWVDVYIDTTVQPSVEKDYGSWMLQESGSSTFTPIGGDGWPAPIGSLSVVVDGASHRRRSSGAAFPC